MNFEKAPGRPSVNETENKDVSPKPEKKEFSPELKHASEFYRSMLLSEDMGINLQSKEILERMKKAGSSKDALRDLDRVRSFIARNIERGTWREGNPIDVLFEDMLVVEGRHADLFGPDANVSRSAEHDDVRNGVDLILELPINPHEDFTEENLARITIDATVSEGREVLKSKLAGIKERPLRSVDYYISPTTNEPVKIENAPHVILNIPAFSLARFIEKSGIAIFYPDPSGSKKDQYTASDRRKKILETYPAARGLLDLIESQLLAQSLSEIERSAKSLMAVGYSAETDSAIASVLAEGAAIGDPFSVSKSERDDYFTALADAIHRMRLDMLKRTGKPFEPNVLLSKVIDAHKAISSSINKKAAERSAAGLGVRESRPVISPAFETSFRSIFGSA